MELIDHPKPFDKLAKKEQLLRVAQNFLCYSEIVVPRSNSAVEARYADQELAIGLAVSAYVLEKTIGAYVPKSAMLSLTEDRDESQLWVRHDNQPEFYENDPYIDYFLESFIENYPRDLTQATM